MATSSQKEIDANQFFDILNQKYFDGKLPKYKIIFDWKSSFGKTEPETLTIHMMDIFISLDLKEGLFEFVLKHEMVHAELYRRGLPDWGKHDENFNKEAKRIGAPYYDY
jgi:hypothetical protein